MKTTLSILLLCLTSKCLSNNAFGDTARIAFYNVENLFDYFKDSIKNDDAWTPRGANRWTKARYEKKQKDLFKVIAALGYEQPLAILGLCEIENKKVLQDLVRGTPLRVHNYRYIHHESADFRGIDVAMIYRPDLFEVLEHYPILLIIPPDTVSRTRDFLYVKGVLFQRDTLHLIICHFPSKFGGLMQTIDRRAFAGRLLREKTDSILLENPMANIITMGDFNDEPSDESIAVAFRSRCDTTNFQPTDMLNLMCRFEGKKGTHKFRETWSIIDQIMISKSLIKNTNGFSILEQKAHIFEPDFLLEDDKVNMGKKPFRTYIGPRYHGGFSDHLPVFVDVVSNFFVSLQK
ncbi:MAG: endonuclease [Bacteroidales bacterium]|jgi:predicted extracellular nuclease|nr:endonuclease [Bacteroidales bacterium]